MNEQYALLVKQHPELFRNDEEGKGIRVITNLDEILETEKQYKKNLRQKELP